MAKRGTTLSSKKGKSKHSPKTSKRLAAKKLMIAKKLIRKARRA
jgi:hypothetical protein